jgi:holo-[acyl-carrier protein] synthase
MILGVGTDLLEISRMRAGLREKAGLKAVLFTPEEIEYCEGKRYPERHYAARFCAKEAFFKALGTGYRRGMSWKEVGVMLDAQGRPFLRLSGKALQTANIQRVGKMHLSLTHTHLTAAAVVVLESIENSNDGVTE